MDELRSVSDADNVAPAAGLTELYDRHVSEIYAFVYRRCGDVALSEDLTQDTFVHAARNYGLTHDPPTVAWLFLVARNRLIDHWRTQASREKRLRWAGALSSEDASDPGDEVVSGQRVLEALAGLPASQQAALVLRYLEGYSTREVATALDRSLKATESLLARARHGLQLACEEQDLV